MIIFGCGPGGEYAAVRASQLGARVALVEIKLQAGGPTGLTSKAVREAAKQISRAVSEYGNKNYKMNVRREIRRLWSRNFKQKRSEAEVMQAAETRARLALNGVDVYIGTGVIQCENDENSDFSDGDDDDDDDDDDEATKGNFFSSAFRNVRNKFATTTSSLVTAPQQNPKTTFTVRVCRAASDCIELTTKRILLATGSRPYQPTYMTNDNARFEIPWTEGKVIHAAKFSSVEQLPNSVAVIGGGVIAVEYATVLSRLKVGVTLIADRKKFMPLLSKETRAQLRRRMKEADILIIDEDIVSIVVSDDKESKTAPCTVSLLDGRRLRVDMVLYSGGRNANSEGLGCENVNVKLGVRGRINVKGASFQTSNPLVHAIGDVIGPPGLASSAMMQAKAVAESVFGNEGGRKGLLKGNVPLTIWTMPEIAICGLTAEKAIALRSGSGSRGRIVTGYAYFKDIARGRLVDPEGFAKVIGESDEDLNTHTILGWEIIGEGANELVQLCGVLVGQVMEDVANTQFSAVTMAAAAQIACEDCLRKGEQKGELGRSRPILR